MKFKVEVSWDERRCGVAEIEAESISEARRKAYENPYGIVDMVKENAKSDENITGNIMIERVCSINRRLDIEED